jgi:hypothetical protein
MLPFRSGRSWKLGTTGFFLTVGLLGYAALAAEPKPSPQKPEASPKSSPSLANIPLPIGQEAKGLVLPDFDVQGHLRARFEAVTAKRVDAEHLELKGLKMTTFTPQNATELLIDMPVSTLDLTTRVITSHERTTVTRTDFNIAGDTMRFDTIARKGTLVGNVKMVITDQSDLRKKPSE